MNTDHEGPGAPVPDELDSTAEENEAVQALYGDRDPTRALEERVVADWRHAVPRTRRPGLKPLAQAAALVVAFWGGTRLGSGAPERPRIEGDDTAQQFVVGPILEPRYAFLIYTDPAVSPPPPSAEAGVVSEYAAWAREIRGSGREVSGERLLDDSRMVAPENSNPTGPLDLGGYFVVQASDIDEAVELARGHPHLRRGGTIEVRPIGPS